VVQGVAMVALAALLGAPPAPDQTRARPVRLVLVTPPPTEEPEVPEPEPEEPSGQLVELPPPEEEQEPEEADYLAENARIVEEETRTVEVEVNPEILAPKHSDEQELKAEDLLDLDIEEESTGAQVGNERFDPDEHGALASLPSPWAVTNKMGLQSPTRASHTDAAVAGAPQNDLLDERRSDEVALNAKKYLYAGYINRIRRVVNFYWQQNLDNLHPDAAFARNAYTTVVDVVLDSEGRLDAIVVSTPSGSERLDAAVVTAFELGTPFPHPPAGLVAKDGRVYLPDFGFDVRFGVAENRYQGIDPRAGVKFPGILKSPR
jgi:TonB family protein